MADTQVTKVDQLKVGDFVKLVDRDKNGKFSYVGEVLTISKETDTFEMLTTECIMGFRLPRTKDKNDYSKPEELQNDLYITATKPTGWAKFKKNPANFKKPEEKKIIPAKPKKQQVMELVRENPRKKEAALLKIALKEIGGSETQLRNYIKLALAKK